MPLSRAELELIRDAARDDAAFARLSGLFEQLAVLNRAPAPPPPLTSAGEPVEAQGNPESRRMELLSNFIQFASHEFRTPLAIIKTSLYLLAKSDDAEQRAAKAVIISEQVNRIDRLVDMLVEQLIVDSGVPFQSAQIDLNSLLRSCIDDVVPAAKKKGIALTYDLAPDLPRIYGDPERLLAALSHIVENAVAFTLAGGAVTVRSRAADGVAVIEVQDTGIGIAEADIPRVFERFYRRDSAHTTPGFGLGLSIASGVIDRHHGRIEVISKTGTGSTFRIVLPSQPAPLGQSR